VRKHAEPFNQLIYSVKIIPNKKKGMALLPELSLEEVRMLTLALNELEVSILFVCYTGLFAHTGSD